MPADRTAQTWLTPEEVADFLCVPKGTVRHWVRVGRLAAISLPGGTRIRIERAALDEFLDRHRTGDPAEVWRGDDLPGDLEDEDR